MGSTWLGKRLLSACLRAPLDLALLSGVALHLLGPVVALHLCAPSHLLIHPLLPAHLPSPSAAALPPLTTELQEPAAMANVDRPPTDINADVIYDDFFIRWGSTQIDTCLDCSWWTEVRLLDQAWLGC